MQCKDTAEYDLIVVISYNSVDVVPRPFAVLLDACGQKARRHFGACAE